MYAIISDNFSNHADTVTYRLISQSRIVAAFVDINICRQQRFQTEILNMFMIHPGTKYGTLSTNGSFAFAIIPKTKYSFLSSDIDYVGP
jgi:hypothetical protein